MSTKNPIVDYLERVAQQYPADGALLDRLAPEHFGTTDDTSPKYIRKTLIAAVARAIKPGCRVDSLLVLHGPQGTGKTAWFLCLMPDSAWFDDGLSMRFDLNDYLRLQNAWIAGWPDFYQLIMVAEAYQIEKWISTTVDRFRAPYQREVKDHLRRCILVSTTNAQKLSLLAGEDLRYWVVPVEQPIPLEQVRAERDRIWAAAYHAYQAGESWHLSPEAAELAPVA